MDCELLKSKRKKINRNFSSNSSPRKIIIADMHSYISITPFKEWLFCNNSKKADGSGKKSLRILLNCSGGTTYEDFQGFGLFL